MESYPKTIEEAVDVLCVAVSPEDRKGLFSSENMDMIQIWAHIDLGRWIRNNFGLWKGNKELLEATGKTHPDDASGVILDAFYERIKKDQLQPAKDQLEEVLYRE